MIAVTFVVMGAAILLISSMSQNSEYDKTKDFYEGTCKTVSENNLVELLAFIGS